VISIKEPMSHLIVPSRKCCKGKPLLCEQRKPEHVAGRNLHRRTGVLDRALHVSTANYSSTVNQAQQSTMHTTSNKRSCGTAATTQAGAAHNRSWPASCMGQR